MDLKVGLRRQGVMLERNDLLGGLICISSDKLARRLFVRVLNSNVNMLYKASSVFNLGV